MVPLTLRQATKKQAASRGLIQTLGRCCMFSVVKSETSVVSQVVLPPALVMKAARVYKGRRNTKHPTTPIVIQFPKQKDVM
jgi:hypothetical protein